MLKETAILEANSVIPDIPNGIKVVCFFKRDNEGDIVKILALGDIGFFGSVGATIKKKGLQEPLRKVSAILQKGDIVFGNLETVLLENISSDMMFCSPSRYLQLLSDNNFKILHLANNHIYDYGREGLESTILQCKKLGIVPLGTGSTKEDSEDIIITEANGLKIGWLGCGYTKQTQDQEGPFYWEFDGEKLRHKIIKVRDKLDILIVSIHIGLMYLDYPDPRHKSMAESLVALGADIVLMHHAHVVQGVKVQRGGKAIFYNLGNFLWDWRHGNVQSDIMCSEQNEGFIFIIIVDKIGISFLGALPTYIDKMGCVNLAEGDFSQKIINRLIKISFDMQQDYVKKFIEQRIERNLNHFIKVLLFHIKAGNWIFIRDAFKSIRREHFSLLFQGLVNKFK